MRDRMIVAVCIIGVLAVFGGIVLFGDSGEVGGDQSKKAPGRPPAGGGAGISIGGPFFNQRFEQENPDASQPVTSAQSSAVAHTRMSAAGGTGARPVVRPAVPAAPPPPVCGASLLGSVVGMLGGLLGGGGC